MMVAALLGLILVAVLCIPGVARTLFDVAGWICWAGWLAASVGLWALLLRHTDGQKPLADTAQSGAAEPCDSPWARFGGHPALQGAVVAGRPERTEASHIMIRCAALALIAALVMAATPAVAQFAVPRRLIEKYGEIRHLDRRGLEEIIVAEHKTVLGRQFFSDAEVDGRTLRLWLVDPDSLSGQNFWIFAELNDVFVVWCACEGTTTVGLDLRHMGGGQQAMLTIRFNRQTGRSEVAQ